MSLSIDQLSAELIAAKKQKDDAAKLVASIEQQIILKQGTAGEEGTKTEEYEEFKVSVVTGYNYKVDQKVLEQIRSELPTDLFNSAFSFKPSLDLKFFRGLKASNPEAFGKVVRAVTATPKKTAVKISAV